MASWSKKDSRDGAWLNSQMWKGIPRLVHLVEQGTEAIEVCGRIFSQIRLGIVSLDVVFGAQDVDQYWVEVGVTGNIDPEVAGSGTSGFDIKR